MNACRPQLGNRAMQASDGGRSDFEHCQRFSLSLSLSLATPKGAVPAAFQK